MPIFRVTMNNTKSNGDKYDPNSKYGISHYHISSKTMMDAIAQAEKGFAGNCEAIITKELTDGAFLIEDMIPLENYELMTAEDSPSDTIIYRKDGNILHVLLRGKDFKERGSAFWYNLSVVDLIRGAGQQEEPPALKLIDLEKLSFEIYRIVKEPRIPAIFEGKMGRKNS
ncbi:hypothetical protein [Planococcus alpniumensis]|uniref:hypothetical protein n=1 Tax=Planococcus alpniumensis TaxID=2708345 RepID=UPI001B8A983D|nr:hypothetical protein [Planococcus sp. MSAK28401]